MECRSRTWCIVPGFVVCAVGLAVAGEEERTEPIDIGSRRELFVDTFLVQKLAGQARQILQRPVPREVVLVCDQPWEGNGVNYVTVFQDQDV